MTNRSTPDILPDHPNLVHVVGAAIIDEQGRCFAARRSAAMTTPLKWEFPGGKVEREETPRGALRRELLEELEVEVEVGEYLARGEVETDHRLIVLDVYICRQVEGCPRLNEHDVSGWFGPSEFATLDWAEADIPVLDHLRVLLREPKGHLKV
jgi:8-oxo-dGTP diphosphatase